MTGRSCFLPLARWGRGLLAILLAIVALGGALHHHPGADSHSACVVCAAGHAAGLCESDATGARAPTPSPERVEGRLETAFLACPHTTPTSRAPPLA